MSNTELQPEQVSRTSRWPRVSLRTWLLLVALVALLGSNLVTAWRLNRSEHDLRKLRDEAGYLTIENPDQIHVVEWPQTEPNVWRWRVYLPTGYKYSLKRRMGEIGPEEFVPAGDAKSYAVSTDLPGGEHLVTLRLSPHPNAFAFLAIEGREGASNVRSSLSEQESRQYVECPDGESIQSSGTSGTETFPLDEPAQLLRRRAMRKLPNGYSEVTNDPMPGVLIWIEKQ